MGAAWLVTGRRMREGSPMRTRQSICEKKARFLSEADARAAADRSGLPLLPYQCDRCRAFHLTSRRKGKRLPKA